MKIKNLDEIIMNHDNSPLIRPLDLVLINTFLHVVDLGGFTAAAEHLHLAQSTVSTHIKRLERTLEQPIFEKNTKQLRLTPLGTRMLLHARRLMHLNNLAWQDIKEKNIDGKIRLGIPDDYLIYLPKVLSDYESQFPNVELEIECDLSVHLLDQLAAGSLDVAITTRQPNSPGGEVLCSEPTRWVAGAGFNTHQRRPLPLAVSRDGYCIFRERAISALDSAGIAWRVAYTSASLSGLSAAVKAGLAVTVMTPSMVTEGLQILSTEHGLPKLADTEIAIHQQPQHQASIAIQKLISLIKDIIN